MQPGQILCIISAFLIDVFFFDLRVQQRTGAPDQHTHTHTRANGKGDARVLANTGSHKGWGEASREPLVVEGTGTYTPCRGMRVMVAHTHIFPTSHSGHSGPQRSGKINCQHLFVARIMLDGHATRNVCSCASQKKASEKLCCAARLYMLRVHGNQRFATIPNVYTRYLCSLKTSVALGWMLRDFACFMLFFG